jgi:hypothetical protein
MNNKQIAGISLESLLATPEWHSLGANLKRLLTVALHTRNLPAVIEEMHLTLDAGLQQKIAEDLLKIPAVRRVVDLYALGVAEPLPMTTPDRETVAPSTDVPVIDCGTFSDAAQPN